MDNFCLDSNLIYNLASVSPIILGHPDTDSIYDEIKLKAHSFWLDLSIASSQPEFLPNEVRKPWKSINAKQNSPFVNIITLKNILKYGDHVELVILNRIDCFAYIRPTMPTG